MLEISLSYAQNIRTGFRIQIRKWRELHQGISISNEIVVLSRFFDNITACYKEIQRV